MFECVIDGLKLEEVAGLDADVERKKRGEAVGFIVSERVVAGSASTNARRGGGPGAKTETERNATPGSCEHRAMP